MRRLRQVWQGQKGERAQSQIQTLSRCTLISRTRCSTFEARCDFDFSLVRGEIPKREFSSGVWLAYLGFGNCSPCYSEGVEICDFTALPLIAWRATIHASA